MLDITLLGSASVVLAIFVYGLFAHKLDQALLQPWEQDQASH